MSLNYLCRALAYALATFLLCGVVNARTPGGDPAKGKELADRLCASCHSENRTGHPPSFERIAKTPHYTPQRLRRIIAIPPHREMPTPGLKQTEIEDLAAYIRSLRVPTNRTHELMAPGKGSAQ